MTAPFGKSDDGDWVETRGQVVRLFHDDAEHEDHQRFVIDVAGGGSLLVAHNLDVAERIPLGLGDRVRVRGLYEFNEQGGVVHFTHHDPHGREAGGWVEFRKKRYA